MLRQEQPAQQQPAQQQQPTAAAEHAAEHAAATPTASGAGGTAQSPRSAVRAAALAGALQALPGPPVHMAYLRAGLPMPQLDDPASFTEEDWSKQGHEVRAVIGHQMAGERLHLVSCGQTAGTRRRTVQGLTS